MKFTVLTGLLLAFLSSFPTAARASCGAAPNAARDFLAHNPAWRMVSLKNLTHDEEALWVSAHGDSCPGITTVRLVDDATIYYALSLFKIRGNYNYHQLVLLKQKNSTGHGMLLNSGRSFIYDGVRHFYVVWMSPPGPISDAESGRSVVSIHESIIYEIIESSATTYYYNHGKVRTVITSE